MIFPISRLTREIGESWRCRQGRRIISPLIERGTLVSDSQKQPLCFGFPEDLMPEYFPKLFNQEIVGESKKNRERNLRIPTQEHGNEKASNF